MFGRTLIAGTVADGVRCGTVAGFKAEEIDSPRFDEWLPGREKEMTRWIPCLISLLALVPQAGVADVYKCRLADGRIEFSDGGCGNGRTVAVQPSETVPPPARVQAEREAERLRNAVEERLPEQTMQQTTVAPAAGSASGSPSPPPRDVVEECLSELGRQSIDEKLLKEMEASCRTNGTAQTAPGMPTGYGGGILIPPGSPTPTPPPPPPTEPPAGRTVIPKGSAQPFVPQATPSRGAGRRATP